MLYGLSNVVCGKEQSDGDEELKKTAPGKAACIVSPMMGLNCVHVCAGLANGVTDPGAAAFPVPPVQAADCSGSGSADQ